jgi:catechol 2,3-dioxygenase-like lactoylglutathione lyase family enzyme
LLDRPSYLDAMRLDHVVIAVTDLERANAFYRDVVGAEVVERDGRVAYRVGDQVLNVHAPGTHPVAVARVPVAAGNSDLCFEWQGPIDTAVAHLREHAVPVELGPLARNGARGRGTSVYFRDPDGSLLEFISYRP